MEPAAPASDLFGTIFATANENDRAELHALLQPTKAHTDSFLMLGNVPSIAFRLDVVLLVRDGHADELETARATAEKLAGAGAASVQTAALPAWTSRQTFAQWYERASALDPDLKDPYTFGLSLLTAPDVTKTTKPATPPNGHHATNGNGKHRPPDPWPALRLDEPPAPLPFPVEVFPADLRDYAQELAEAIATPVEMVAGSMLATASVALGQSCNVLIKGKGQSAWIESPCLWVILVARPGFAKSPAIRIPVKPLAEIDQALRKQSAEDFKHWTDRVNAFKAAQNQQRRKKLEEILDDVDAPQPPGDEPKQRRAVIKDFTREALIALLASNPRGILCDPDEAGTWVGNFDAYSTKKSAGRDRQMWLSLFNSEYIATDRDSGRKQFIAPRPLVSVIAGIQPDMLSTLADDRGRDDGFLDRILWICPDQAAWPKPLWSEAEVSEYTSGAWSRVIRRLHSRTMYEVEGEDPRPWVLQFSDDARAVWRDLYNAHVNETLDPNEPTRHTGAASKMRALAARLALILSQLRVADRPGDLESPGKIQPPDVIGAWALIKYFRSQLDRIHSTASGAYAHPGAAALLNWLLKQPRESFREAEARNAIRRFRNDDEGFDRALKKLECAGAIRPAGGRNLPRTGGRPASDSYDCNPLLYSAPKNPRAPENPTSVQAQTCSSVQFSGAQGFSGAPLVDPAHASREPGCDDAAPDF